MSACVLHVEPDPAEGAILRSVLRDVWPGRFALERVEDAAAALVHLDSDVNAIDCLLLTAGVRHQLAAVAHVRGVAPDLPIVVISATDDVDAGLQLVRAGAQDHLVHGADGYQVGRALLYAIERARVGARSPALRPA
jgi:DNA-binding NtrC family response regulator